MSNLKKQTSTEFNDLFCTQLIVKPQTTFLKWDANKKSEGMSILGSADIIKTNALNTFREVLGGNPFVIGTDSITFIYDIFVSGTVNVGMSLSNFTPVASRQVNVVEGDVVKMILTTASVLSIKLKKKMSSNTIIYDLADYVGQSIFAWLSVPALESASVKISHDVAFTITTDSDGKVRMTSAGVEIVDFAQESMTNTASGASITIDDDGNTFIDGGLSYKVTDITAAIANVNLALDQNIVTISNAAILTVTLPPITTQGKTYTIIRNYPLQGGETWQSPALLVLPDGTDTIDGLASQGVPVDATVHLVSDGMSTWKHL